MISSYATSIALSVFRVVKSFWCRGDLLRLSDRGVSNAREICLFGNASESQFLANFQAFGSKDQLGCALLFVRLVKFAGKLSV